ncbi:preprotein translocase subunit YajC [Wolbachia pipientis]|uniref:Sec translocon accessory complex subunit YajC n=1 Tax=Wolbachia pipientis TaxID=955 RepID=A0A1E7QL03_WOLPI|nr:preprotein translocase subunit YajC [Wolbachia pipientis]OEY87155.1 preprotein translocase subunit YajC [Wolbachia pipientis]
MFIYEASAVPSTGSFFINLLPLVLISLVFYFLILRPQQNKVKEHKSMINSIKRGDTVITSGGIIGEVNKVDEANAQFVIEIAPKIEVKVLKSAVSEVSVQANKKNKDKEQNTPKKNDKSKDS